MKASLVPILLPNGIFIAFQTSGFLSRSEILWALTHALNTREQSWVWKEEPEGRGPL